MSGVHHHGARLRLSAARVHRPKAVPVERRHAPAGPEAGHEPTLCRELQGSRTGTVSSRQPVLECLDTTGVGQMAIHELGQPKK